MAWRTPALNIVDTSDEHTVVLRLLADRDHQITAQRTRSICRLHALLCLLIEGGTGRSLTVARAEKLLASVHVDGRSRSSGSPPHANCSTKSAPSTPHAAGPPTPRHGACGSKTTVTEVFGIE